MASVIVLVYGEGRHLVPKPADYETLLDVAHVKFRELYDFDEDNIDFHFTPRWLGDEVVLDRNVLAQVQDRDVLRITATASAAAKQPCNIFKIQDNAVSAIVSADEMPAGWMKLRFIHGKCTPNRKCAPHQTLEHLHLELCARVYADENSSY